MSIELPRRSRVEAWVYRASRRPVSAFETFAAGLALLVALTLAHARVAQRAARAQAELATLDEPVAEVLAALETAENLNALKANDVEKTKTATIGLAKRHKKYYEDRLFLSEERRQLEKQWELLITTLALDVKGGRLKVMRGDQAAREYPAGPVVCWSAAGSAAKAPKWAVVNSKERFAHPERGKVEMLDGKLNWTPPQVGPASRSAALGEFVAFTNTPLILHAPSKDAKAHEAYPHCCLPMTPATAKKVYDSVAVGTRVVLEAR